MSEENKSLITDRGKYLKTMVETSGVVISKLMEKIGYKDRASYYTHIVKPNLSLDILSDYARALNVDIRRDFPELIPIAVQEPAIDYSLPETKEEAIEKMQHWKEKYFLLLEKYSAVLENKLSGIR